MEETMGYESRQDYLETQRARYRRAARAGKARILDEGCALFGVHRKSLIRAFARPAQGPKKRRGPRPRYGPELLAPLKTIWLGADQMCSKRLAAALPFQLNTS